MATNPRLKPTGSNRPSSKLSATEGSDYKKNYSNNNEKYINARMAESSAVATNNWVLVSVLAAAILIIVAIVGYSWNSNIGGNTSYNPANTIGTSGNPVGANQNSDDSIVSTSSGSTAAIPSEASTAGIPIINPGTITPATASANQGANPAQAPASVR